MRPPSCQRVVGHERAFGDFVVAAEPVTFGARALGGVGRKRLGVQQRLSARVIAGPRIQHAQQVRERRDAADRRARRGCSALLLQRDRGRQPFDVVDLGHRHLVEEPPRVGRDRLEVAALGFGVERAKGERRFAGPGYAGEHDQRIARDLDRDVAQVVLACAAHPHEAWLQRRLLLFGHGRGILARRAASAACLDALDPGGDARHGQRRARQHHAPTRPRQHIGGVAAQGGACQT